MVNSGSSVVKDVAVDAAADVVIGDVAIVSIYTYFYYMTVDITHNHIPRLTIFLLNINLAKTPRKIVVKPILIDKTCLNRQ